jgi:hypothetical protein
MNHPFISKRKIVLLDANLLMVLIVSQLGDVLLTVDLDLYGFVVGRKLEAINFNHLRML